ncbi:MAG: hypothetical protein ND895_18200 [Pyrinomonadaceae bacterium]|nr:hypothetical protein [Pyrinomonadaceae bacterium]
MILTDPKWEKLEGGYRIPYDPRPVLSKLASGIEVGDGWEELWNELHHQGDVGEASYAAVTALVDLYSNDRQPDWNLFSLSAIVEIERHRKGNPPLPQWLSEDYQRAWRKLAALALAALRVDEIDSDTLQSALAVVAIARGDLRLGAMINHLDSSELDEILEQYLGWQELYVERAS